MLASKFFVLVCLIPAAFAFALFPGVFRSAIIIVKFAVIVGISLMVGLTIHRVIPKVNPLQMLVNKQAHSIKEADYYNAGSRINITNLEPTPRKIIQAIPQGISNTILRPYAWEGKNLMMIASAFENLIVIGLIALCLILSDFKQTKQLNLILFLLTFSLGYFALIGICTPVLGNLVRYRAPLLPIFLFAFALPIKPNPHFQKFKWLLR
jgi:hypothetical protein